jgi:aspartate/methionine/tyrosine aminotransferase
VFFLTNPNNPTGLYIPTDVLTELVSACEAVGSYVVVDEACDIPLTPGWRDRRWPDSAALIRIGSFSKQYLLAGFRLGYIVAAPDLIDEFASMYAFADGNAPVVANAEVRRLLEDDELSTRIAERAHARVKFALRRLTCWSRVRLVIEPQACYYIFLELDARHDSWTLFTHFLRAGVNVVPGELFGLAGQPPWIRICVGRSEEILATGLDRLRIGLQEVAALPSA